jgi:membrane carboxypeptidase/penicillin-binding protein
VAVLIGFDDNRTLGEKETGRRTALPVFCEIMLRVYRDRLGGPVSLSPRKIEKGIDGYPAMQTLLEAVGDEPAARAATLFPSPQSPLLLR